MSMPEPIPEQMVKFIELTPCLGTHRHLYMLEPCTISVRLIPLVCEPSQSLVVEIWTNTIDKMNPDGQWHGLPMRLISELGHLPMIYVGSFLPTAPGNFAYTVRIGLRNNQDQSPAFWQWAGAYQENGYLSVLPPSPQMDWTLGPQAVEIAPYVLVGNFIAASQAPNLGFQAVLNMAQELDLHFPDKQVIYKKIGLLDGAHHPIPKDQILEAVTWIQDQVYKGYRVCINCRAGIGRSGSIGVAYLYALYPGQSYQDTLQMIWSKKPDIYPHQNLMDTLCSLFPRTWQNKF